MERRLGRWWAGRLSRRTGNSEDTVRAEDRGAVETALREGARRDKRGDTVGAAQSYGRADQLGSGEGASSLGVLLFERGEVAAAEAVLRRADERRHPTGTFRLGFLLEETGRTDDSIAAYRRAAALGNLHAMDNLGHLLQRRGDLAGDRAAYQQIIDDGSDQARVREAHRVVARLAALIEGIDRGEVVPAHVGIGPYVQALLNAGETATTTDSSAAAGVAWGVSDQRPDDPQAIDAVVSGAVVVAEAMLADDRHQEAWDRADSLVRVTERWCELDPRNAEAHLCMSRIMTVLAVAGMAVRPQPTAVVDDPLKPGGPIAVESAYFFGMAAIRNAQRALALDPDNVATRLHLGRRAWRLGRYLKDRSRVPGDEDTDYAQLVIDSLGDLDTDERYTERGAEPLAWARHTKHGPG